LFQYVGNKNAIVMVFYMDAIHILENIVSIKIRIKLMSDLRARLRKILDLYGQTLFDVAVQREPNDFAFAQRLDCKSWKCATSLEAQLSAQDLVLRFAGADSTDGKSRTQWMVKTYIADEHFKLEDLGRVHAALTAFERFKRRLPMEQRELSRLKSLRDFEALVAPFLKAEAKARLEQDLSSATGREKKRLEEWKAWDESIVIHNNLKASCRVGEGLPTIAVPMTEFASCWWGKGTTWCTAAEKDNRFISYHVDAPLIVVICQDGEKFQAYVTESHIQFMDATDTGIQEKTIRARWHEFKSLLDWALLQNGLALKFVPEDFRTPELCQIAIEQNGMALQYVPECKRTPELYRLAIERDGWALGFVPEDKKTLEICQIAVQHDGDALRYVPYDLISSRADALQEESLFAGKSLGCENNKTPELFRMAVEQNGGSLYYIPKDQRTPELCRLAVEKDGEALEYVPEQQRTPELCQIAVERNGLSLSYVPENYRTPELCRLAIKQDGRALGSVPRNNITPEICYLSVGQDGRALQFVPPNYKTFRLCRFAVERNGWALRFVPRDLILSSTFTSISPICEENKALELCILAIKQNGQTLDYVPEKYRTPELLALIPPSQPKWHPDILHRLCSYF
jgi:Domain of unknown function (DUF4116)